MSIIFSDSYEVNQALENATAIEKKIVKEIIRQANIPLENALNVFFRDINRIFDSSAYFNTQVLRNEIEESIKKFVHKRIGVLKDRAASEVANLVFKHMREGQ